MDKPTQNKPETDKKSDQKGPQPDPETLHTPDPQEHMKGPISSIMQNIKEGAEENDQEDQEKIEQGKK